MAAGTVKFMQGAQGTSLPADIRPGSIYIIERDSTRGVGDMYVDLPNGTNRIHITPDMPVIPSIPDIPTFVDYEDDMANTESIGGVCYIFNQNGKHGIGFGDDVTPIGDLPVYDTSVENIINRHTTEINSLKHKKINAYLGTEYLALNSEYQNADIGAAQNSHLYDGIDQNTAAETLVLTRELWL